MFPYMNFKKCGSFKECFRNIGSTSENYIHTFTLFAMKRAIQCKRMVPSVLKCKIFLKSSSNVNLLSERSDMSSSISSTSESTSKTPEDQRNSNRCYIQKPIQGSVIITCIFKQKLKLNFYKSLHKRDVFAFIFHNVQPQSATHCINFPSKLSLFSFETL